MLTLIHKELLAHLLSLRLTVALIFTVVLCVLTTLVGSLEYAARVDAYAAEVRKEREELEAVTVYRQIDLDLLFPPQPLSILCRGISETAAYRLGILLDYRPFPPAPIGNFGGAGSDVMRTLVQADFATVVALVLSFLAVVLGFDGICGEREQGTLRLLLANPVPRAALVLSKLVAGLLSLWVPLALAFVLALLVMHAVAGVHLSASDWLRLFLFFLLSCLFLGQIFSLSLMVSAFCRRAATALVICLFGWLAGGVGYASVLPSLVRYGVKEEPGYQETLDREAEVWKAFDEAMAAWEKAHPPPGPAYMKAWEQEDRIRYGRAVGYRWRQQRTAYEMKQRLDGVAERHRIWQASLDPLAREAFLIDAGAILSPFTNYQVLSNYLANTTLEHRFFLRALGERYRETFLSYLDGRSAFADRRWFSDDPLDQEPMIPRPEEVTREMLMPGAPFLEARLRWVQRQLIADEGRRKLDLTDLPKLGQQGRRPVSDSLALMTPGLSVLVLLFGLGVLLTVLRFSRYDPL